MASTSLPASTPAASGGGSRKRGGVDSSGSFLKTFPSDVEDAMVHKLLLEIKTTDPAYKDFTTRDLKLLASLLSALRFESGDKIVCRGEDASFWGLVLKGSFACVIDDRPGVGLRRGEMFGEQEFFESPPSQRKHDMVAATAGIVGILTYDDLKLVGLTSIELHIKLMQLIAVSSMRKMKGQLQQSPYSLGAGGSATPKVRSRRGSMTAATTNGQQLSSAASSPAMSPPLSVSPRPAISTLSLGAGIDGGSGSPLTPHLDTPTLDATTSPSPVLLIGVEAAIASAVAAALADSSSADNSKLRRGDSAPDAASSSSGLELLFRCRMKKHAHIKPRRIEAEAIELVDASLPASSVSAAAAAGSNGVVLPPLAGKDGRSSFPGSGSAAQSTPTSSPGSTSSSSAAAATDKSNHNYILYALRNKVAKQEDVIEAKEALVTSLTSELRAAQEQATLDAQRIAELEARHSASSKETSGSLDRVRKLEMDLTSLRAELARATKTVEQLEAERKATQDQTAAMVSAMQARLREHAEILEEPAGMGLGITAAAAAAAAASAASNSTNNSPTKPAASPTQDPNSKYALTRLMSSNTAISYAKYSSRSTAPAVPASKFSYTAADHAALHDSLSSVTAAYDALLLKLADRVSEQDRALTGMHKWKHRATEFATTWDVERKMLRDRIKTLLLEIENLKTLKDSYKILLKVVTIKIFMQHSAVRKLLRGVYRKCVDLTTAILIEQRASGGGGMGAEEGRMLHGRAGVTQADNNDELQVRVQRKMQEKPWGGRGGGGGAQLARPAGSPANSSRRSAAPSRPAPLKSLIESLDDELSTLVSATEGVVASKTTWQETSESFFQRNIELSQRVGQLEAEHAEATAATTKLQRELGHSRQACSALEAQLGSLTATHKSKLAELSALSHKSSTDLRQKRSEVDALFEKTVELKRRMREGEIAAAELEKKEVRLHERNDALLSEQRKLTEAIRMAREIEASLARGNAKAYATLVASSAQGAAMQPSLGLAGPSMRTLRNSHSSAAAIGLQHHQQQLLQSQDSQAQFGPFVASPPRPAHRSGSAGGGVSQNAHTQSLPHFSQTLPASGSLTTLHTVASAGSLATESVPEGDPSAAVLATIRARPAQTQLQQQQQQLLSAAQWSALATAPASDPPATARPAPSSSASSSMQPLRAKRGSATARGAADKSSSAAAAAAQKRAIASALHRDSLDRALFRAAKAGLGRTHQSPNKSPARGHAQVHSGSCASSSPSASFADESKESSTSASAPTTLPPLPPSTPLREMIK